MAPAPSRRPARPSTQPVPPDDVDQGSRRHWTRAVGLVAAGGAVGTGARVLISHSVPLVAGAPAGIFLINMTGSFLLGLLLQILARSGPDTGHRQGLRLLLGSGVLGGFTTYSALAVDTAALLRAGHASVGVAYPLASLVGGVALSWLGTLTGQALPRPWAQRRARQRAPR